MIRPRKAVCDFLTTMSAVACLSCAAISSLAADGPREAETTRSEQAAASEEAPKAQDAKEAKQRKNAAKKAKAAEKRNSDKRDANAKTGEKESTDKKPADKKSADKKPADKKGAKKSVIGAKSPPEEQESAALGLVSANHPELLDLLQRLKADNPKQYQQAIAELYRASQRLADRQAKDPARYELELRAWKLDSQARLLAAKLTMDAKPELEEQLKAVLVEREDVAVALLEMDRNRLADRLEQVERQLDNRREQREARSQRAFEQLTRRAGKSRVKNAAAKDVQAAAKNSKSGDLEKQAAAQPKAEADKQGAPQPSADRDRAPKDAASDVQPGEKP